MCCCKVTKKSDFHGLKEKLYRKLKINKYKNRLSIKYFFKNNVLFPTVPKCDDEDLEEFMNLHIGDKYMKAIMYVSIYTIDIGQSM